MNILSEPFVNDVNLAICIFPADTLGHEALKDKMTEYTTFYAMRFNQLIKEGTSPIDIYQAESITAALHDLSDKYDHILLMASGVRILDMSVIYDIKKIIENNDYFVAAHILDWKENWYELHHHFLLVNSKKWIAAGSPNYGSWEHTEQELPVIERSIENFHDDYTPLWIKFTGEYKNQLHTKQGWNFINVAARNNYSIINWDLGIRFKRTYYYPEDHSEDFYKSINELNVIGITNPNQIKLIKETNNIANQIWILNSENMDLEIPPEKFDTLTFTASGFKFLEAFNSDRLNENGKLVIYDFNPLSIEWIKQLHTSSDDDILKLISDFPNKNNFKFFGSVVFSDNGEYTKEFIDSLNITRDYFGGKDSFLNLIKKFRDCKVDFVQVDLFNEPEKLTNTFEGKTLINISNIFCTDFTNIFYGISKSTEKLKALLSTIKTECLIVGQDSYCRPIKKRINN
jgi:hypothetical protein